jgi:hypothetical protein
MASLGCTPSCVARGARVRVPGRTRAIEELAVGDEVLCVDPDTGRSVPSRLVEIRRAERECVRLTSAEGGLTLTSDHPIYCPVTRQWAPAGDWALRRRSKLLVSRDETVRVATVEEVSAYAGVFEVFDLSVEHPLHNFVANGVLVHNKKPIPWSCKLPDGGMVSEYSACVCPGGSAGETRCEFEGAAVCISCPPFDAGNSDGGP